MKRDIPKPDGPESVAYRGKIIELVHQLMKIGEKKTIFEFARRSPGTRTIIHDFKNVKILITKEYQPRSATKNMSHTVGLTILLFISHVFPSHTP